MRVNRHSQSAKAGQIIQMSRSLLPGVVGRESAFRRVQILSVHTAILLRFSCAEPLFVNTIYGILPNFPRQTFAVVSGVKIGLPQKLVFSIVKLVFAVNQYNFRLLQKLAKYQTFLKFSDHYCR